MGPEHLLDSKSRGLNRLTEKMTAFYEQFKQEDVVKIDDPGFLEGKKLILESCLKVSKYREQNTMFSHSPKNQRNFVHFLP